jgi:hypothetical protein
VFRATHNSYSGGSRRTIRAQLDAGVRLIELDVHAPAAAGGDFQVGHVAPGHEVARGGGNPDGIGLREWLEVVESWAAARRGAGGAPRHGVLTVALDLKSALVRAAAFESGSLAALNGTLRGVFGDALVTPGEFERSAAGSRDGPTLEALRGRVIVVLSGHPQSRVGYRWDVGANPAVAVNERGWVVEVHESPTGPTCTHDLWYWTGRRGEDGAVEWMRHGKYDSGTTPAVAVNNAGLVVAVHRSGLYSSLWCRAGELNEATGDIRWGARGVKYDTGAAPTVAFQSLSGAELREIHRSQKHVHDKWSRRGVASAGGVAWEANGKTADEPFDKATARLRGGVCVSVTSSPSAGNGAPVARTLQYTTRTPRGSQTGRIVYPQVAFIEWQEGSDPALAADDVFFHASAAARSNGTAQQRRAGLVVRQWAFNTPPAAVTPPPSFPATDEPFAEWYEEYCTSAGSVRD